MSLVVRAPVALGVAAAVGATARRLVDEHAARRQAERRDFRLHDDEHGADAIRRIAVGQVDDAMDRLRTGDAEAIHDARKAFKRARAALRLGRDAIERAAYRNENTALRDVGRRLAAARDADVVVETLDALTERYREQLPPGAFAGLRAALAAEARSAQAQSPALLPAVISELGAVRERIASLDGDADDDALVAGFKRIYRRGRRASRQAQERPDAEPLHELRKRAKDLWHAAQIMRGIAPKRMRKRAHELADLLGDEHDLTVLREAAAGRSDTLRPGEPLLLRTVAGERQDELRREALELAQRLYSRKPRKVAKLVKLA